MRILISILSLFFFVSGAWSQQSFYKLYAGNGFDKGEDILELLDTSYFVTGSSGSWGENGQAFLMKIDSLGNYVWSHSYGGNESEESVSVMHRPGSGFYLAGMSNSSNLGNFDAMLVKTDDNGNQEWLKTYPTAAWERINDAVMTKDTGFVLVGQRQALLGANSDILLMRMDKNGDTLWTKSFGSVGNDQANAVTRFQDSLYVIVGQAFVPDSNLVKGFMITMNDQGTILSQIDIGTKSGTYHLTDVEPGENKYYLVGYREVNETNHDNYIRILDENGILQDEFTELDNLPAVDDRQFNQVVFLPNPQYKISMAMQYRNSTNPSFSYDLNNGFYDAANGYWLGQSTTMIINDGIDQCTQMLPTHDGGYISVGFNTVVGDGQNALNGGSNVYVLKINPSQTTAVVTDTVFTLNQLVETIELNQMMIELILYPNPTSNDLHVSLSEQVSGDYFVSDLMGKRMLTGELESNFTIESSTWNQGVYFLNIGQHSFKFIKQ